MERLLDAIIRDPLSGRKLAAVTLNGYNATVADPVVGHKVLRSFRLVAGDLRPQWQLHKLALLCVSNGQGLPIRIAAIPTEDDGWGLLEFVLPVDAARRTTDDG
jgi:hypothetical protein